MRPKLKNEDDEQLLLASSDLKDIRFTQCVTGFGTVVKKAGPILQLYHDRPELFDINHIFDEGNPVIDLFTDLIETFDIFSRQCGLKLWFNFCHY